MKRLLTILLVPLGLAAFPAVTYAEHSWGTYHWATSTPFTLGLGDNVSSKWDAYLGEASTDWTSSSVLDTQIVAGGTTSDPKKCRPTSGRVEVCNANYGGAWLGLAQIWVSSSHIYQATSKMNDFYFNKEKYNKPEWRRFVMCQEVGHTFGLDHQNENFNDANLGSCMDYTSNPLGPPSNEHPNSHDYEQLERIYNAHQDGSTTVAQIAAKAPSAMNDIDFSGPGQWGRLIRSTNRGLTELYELDFGGGYKLFTFVIWAAGEDRGRR
ncbi:MAG: hypothetical protein HY527_06785 [Betaproteobacteria bacterium]|nr:hypothetical protein [Betaproteobacteria bacterium]